MPSITVTIAGMGRTRTISAGDLSTRLMPALRYFNPALEEATDQEVLQHWADQIMEDLKTSVANYEDAKRTKSPLTLT
jgi:hypothetical protein